LRAIWSTANAYTYSHAMHGQMYAYAQAATDSTATAQSIAK